MISMINTPSIKLMKRNGHGSSIAELPFALLILVIVLLFPLIDLGTVALRGSTVYEAARNAAHHAGRAKTFLQDGAEGELSAKNTAVRWSALTCQSSLAGTQINPEDVQAKIIATPFDPKLFPIRSSDPLQEVATQNYVYQIEVTVTGSVQPLVMLSTGMFGIIPGVTSPLKLSATFREFCEHPNGLTI